jgi:uncharacterized RDD family membrane protein YckC
VPGQAGPPPAPPGYIYPPGFGYPPPPPPVAPGGQRLAEFTDRLLARLIDTAILGGATAVVIIPICLIAVFAIFDNFSTTVTIVDGEPVGGRAPIEGADVFAYLLPLLGIIALLILLSLLLAYLYDVEMMFRSGQTIGKRIMKIQVIPLDPAQTLTRGLAVKRFLIQHVAVMFVPLLNWIDGLWQLWDKPYRQCLHDKFATTTVIKLGP